MKKKIKVVLVSITSIIIGMGILLGGLLYYRMWTPFMDDGPFFGVPRVSYPTEPADQVMPIMNGMQLKVFSRKTNDPAPTVLLQDKNGKVLWCIFATAYEKADVRELHFAGYKTLPFLAPRIVGWVKWTYGHEAMWWFIDRSGKLKGYWYSW